MCNLSSWIRHKDCLRTVSYNIKFCKKARKFKGKMMICIHTPELLSGINITERDSPKCSLCMKRKENMHENKGVFKNLMREALGLDDPPSTKKNEESPVPAKEKNEESSKSSHHEKTDKESDIEEFLSGVRKTYPGNAIFVLGKKELMEEDKELNVVDLLKGLRMAFPEGKIAVL